MIVVADLCSYKWVHGVLQLVVGESKCLRVLIIALFVSHASLDIASLVFLGSSAFGPLCDASWEEKLLEVFYRITQIP